MLMQPDEKYGREGPFYDDLTKQQLPTQLVRAARRKELDYLESKNVWKLVSLAEAQRISGHEKRGRCKPIRRPDTVA